MQRKLNEEFIKEYSAQFSEKITSNFFTDKSEISGKEILKVSPSKQVNFFILKILFGKWQEEMKRLESPYFNYRNTEVRRAMVDFMNMLSQHIEVGGDHFISLAEEAVESTLKLLINPAEFLESEFADKNISTVTGKVTRPIFKYIKLHKDALEQFFNEHEGENLETFFAEARAYFDDVEDEEVVNQELEILSGIVPIDPDQLFIGSEFEDTPSVAPTVEGEEDIPGLDEEEMEDEEPERTDQGEGIERAFESEEPFEDEDHFEDDEPSPEPDEKIEDADKLNFDGEESVNEQYADPPSTLNDKFSSSKEKQTVADQLQTKKVANIMEAISVNHRYMFTKELFDGDRDAFNTAIERVEACGSFDDAVELLVQEFARERQWDMNSDEVKELLKMIFRKFR